MGQVAVLLQLGEHSRCSTRRCPRHTFRCLPQVAGQLRAAELDAALAAVDAEEEAELAALQEAGSARLADAVRTPASQLTSAHMLRLAGR